MSGWRGFNLGSALTACAMTVLPGLATDPTVPLFWLIVQCCLAVAEAKDWVRL